jgi:hypothetical protein
LPREAFPDADRRQLDEVVREARGNDENASAQHSYQPIVAGRAQREFRERRHREYQREHDALQQVDAVADAAEPLRRSSREHAE